VVRICHNSDYETPESLSDIIALLRDAAKKSNQNISVYIELLTKENAEHNIENWIKFDIERIVKICQRAEIKVILQNYPTEEVTSEAIKEVALKYNIPFVDNFQIFNELWKNGEKPEDYYQPDRHCRDKGYAVMAENIYNKLLEDKMLELEIN